MSYTNPNLLWSPQQTKDHLADEKLVVLDLRQPEAYANGHIPGARSFDIFGISLIDTREGPLNAFLWIIEHLIGAKGVNSDSTVVVHDAISGERAARLFWFLEFLGHEDVHMMNGGFNAWKAAGLPVTHEAEIPTRGNFKARTQPNLLATAEDVVARLGKTDVAIVDTRSAEENAGTLVRSARGGKVPGAVHLEWKNNLAQDGTFKPAADLAAQYEAIGVTPDHEVIPYCQGGYRSAHTYVALRLLGYPKVRNYLGSWGEWGNRAELPIETTQAEK